MTAITVQAQVLQRRDSTESWESNNPILPDGQLGWERDIYGQPIGVKMGDGVTAWSDLPYWFVASSGSAKATLLPTDPRITHDTGTGNLSLEWDSVLQGFFGITEPSVKFLTANGYDYQQIPYMPSYQYSGLAVSFIVFSGIFDTDYKIIITI